MKSGLHPNYFENASVSCACGAVLATGSTVEKSEIEICSNCHPFYTGKKKTIDTTGRVDRFKKRAEKTQAIMTQKVIAPKKEKEALRKKKQTEKKSSVYTHNTMK
jgi:large subunit ribosomal protein L31